MLTVTVQPSYYTVTLALQTKDALIKYLCPWDSHLWCIRIVLDMKFTPSSSINSAFLHATPYPQRSSLHSTVRTWTELHLESVLRRCWSSVWPKLSCWRNSHCHQCLWVHRSVKTNCCSGAGHLLAAYTRTITQQAVTLSTIVMDKALQGPPRYVHTSSSAWSYVCVSACACEFVCCVSCVVCMCGVCVLCVWCVCSGSSSQYSNCLTSPTVCVS